MAQKGGSQSDQEAGPQTIRLPEELLVDFKGGVPGIVAFERIDFSAISVPIPIGQSPDRVEILEMIGRNIPVFPGQLDQNLPELFRLKRLLSQGVPDRGQVI